jgi:hypothetical protein
MCMILATTRLGSAVPAAAQTLMRPWSSMMWILDPCLLAAVLAAPVAAAVAAAKMMVATVVLAALEAVCAAV